MGVMSINHNNSILPAKAWGMKEGVRYTLAAGIKNLTVEGDNLVCFLFSLKDMENLLGD